MGQSPLCVLGRLHGADAQVQVAIRPFVLGGATLVQHVHVELPLARVDVLEPEIGRACHECVVGDACDADHVELRAALAVVGITPCGDNSCMFGTPGGMATNGGCSCFKEARMTPQKDQVIYALQSLVGQLALELEIRREGEP